jgi:hypothetical protein
MPSDEKSSFEPKTMVELKIVLFLGQNLMTSKLC